MEHVPDRFIEVGRIGRPRGLDGVVRVIPDDNFSGELLNRIPLLYWRNERSDLVPARIENVHSEQKKNHQSFFVKFDLIAGRNEAERAKDKALFAEIDLLIDLGIEREPSSNNDSLYGFTVFYEENPVGEILEVLENPAHPIIEVKMGTGTVLIPFVDEYIKSVNQQEQTVTCINLDRLTDM